MMDSPLELCASATDLVPCSPSVDVLPSKKAPLRSSSTVSFSTAQQLGAVVVCCKKIALQQSDGDAIYLAFYASS